jgi:aspartate dehydrogenase
LNVGLIGCGAIGITLARAISDGKAGGITLIAVSDIDESKLNTLSKKVQMTNVLMTTEPNKIITDERIDLVIEAASREAVKSFAEKALTAGKHMLIMSVGALSDNVLLSRLENVAREKTVKIYLPSGAICGLDGVKAASVEAIHSAEITSIKHPKSLLGAPFLVENKIDLSQFKTSKVIFQGTAREAISGFPKNVNVAVALSLAGLGVDRTIVKIIADPEAIRTQHNIHVKGDFGELNTLVKNHVHPGNPKTSYLAALAAIQTLRKITEPIQLGT